ncbi:MAG: BatD family protein [Ignavibacteriaceae bacterium]|nr:BatD family protein [Ignavibacteriaceae bacterium]MCW8817816.1 BatD family protein [Ignavibacteriaceae bacterium]
MLNFKRNWFLIFAFCLAILTQQNSFAQEFTASVDETTVSDNERFQVSFTFSGSSINDLSKFSPPSFENFTVLSGPNQSTSIQIINGAQSASLTYSFVIQAKSVGTFSIGSASIEQNGTTYKSDPLKITVIKGTAKPQRKNDNSQISNEEIAKNLFIKTTVDKTRVYKGEQVTVTYKLYTRLSIAAQMSVNKLPQYQGFWAEELETPNNISFRTEVVGGKQFRMGVLKKAALFPTQTGTLEVTPFELNVPVQIKKQKSRSIWDDFFNDPFGRSEVIEFNAKSNVVKIEVEPLPPGQPGSFNGAVGDYSFDAKLNNTTTKSNEPLTLNVNISGTGNIKLLDMPEINFPNGFEKYEPKVSEDINRKSTISGTKKGEYLFVPRVVGIREIPPIEFSYFNPKKKKYVTLKSQKFTIDIKPGDKLASTGGVGKEDIKQLGEDIRFIKTSYNDIEKQESYIFNSTGFLIAGALPFLLSIGLIGWKRRYDKLHGNVVLLRYQKAQKVAKNRLKLAKKLMDTQNYKEFYTELSSALFGYLEDKLHIPKSEFTVERASDDLRNKNVSDHLLSELKASAEKCEFVRFAPGAEKSTAMKEMYDEIADVIINLEKNILGKKNV